MIICHSLYKTTAGAVWKVKELASTTGRLTSRHSAVQSTFSHLEAFPRRPPHSAQRGRWRRTCWWSALWSSTARPWPGQTLGTGESLPPCPDWPAPSCSFLPGTDPTAALENHTDNLKTRFISRTCSLFRILQIGSRIQSMQKWRTAKTAKHSLKKSHNSFQFCTITYTVVNWQFSSLEQAKCTEGQKRIKIDGFVKQAERLTGREKNVKYDKTKLKTKKKIRWTST